MKKLLIAFMLSASMLTSYAALATVVNTQDTCVPKRDASGRIARSATQVNHFKKANPCPANGHTSGACPGYVVDHIKPLCACGADDPSNMQWQTLAESKIKDKEEVKLCKGIK